MSDVSNLGDTIVPKSDQLNADQLLGGPITVTINAVKRSDADQPVSVHYDGDEGRPYKPCKSMRKVMIFAWGDDGREWVGKSMTLFNDPEVKFGGIKVGGIRISHMSHIERDIQIALTTTKGKKGAFFIKKLEVRAQAPAAKPAATDWLQAHLKDIASATDMDALKSAYERGVKAAAQHQDAEAKAKIVAAKDTRKQQLAAIAAAVDATTGDTPAKVDAETGEVIL